MKLYIYIFGFISILLFNFTSSSKLVNNNLYIDDETLDYISKFSNDFSKFSFNNDNRLKSAYFLYPEDANEKCKQQYKNLPINEYINDAEVSNEFIEHIKLNSEKILDSKIQIEDSNGCDIVCLPLSQHKNFIMYPLREQIGSKVSNVNKFFNDHCLTVGLIILNFSDIKLDVKWVDPMTKNLVTLNSLEPREKLNKSHRTFIGHQFVLTNSVTQEEVKSFTVTGNGCVTYGIGQSVSNIYLGDNQTIENKIEDIFKTELDRSKSIKRTFSELGFKKEKLPKDIWGSMSAYYYSNAHNAFEEVWTLDLGYHVNWWEANTYMVWIPLILKNNWANRLQLLVEKWVGIPLEPTSLYGMRKYTGGARLLTHVDRTETHAASLIVNIAQRISSPWPVEIYDFKQRLHEIEMEEGDVVFYESAKCLHGRMTPLALGPSSLEETYYVNLFTHYRPVGDKEWYLKEKDSFAPDPLYEFTNEIPKTLSLKNQVLESNNDLFSYWKSIPKIIMSHSEL